MVFGTFIGSLADRFGRKRVCLVYVAVYIVSCVTKHVNSYSVLMVGRLLGGVATSLLYSVFDAWMINEVSVCCEPRRTSLGTISQIGSRGVE